MYDRGEGADMRDQFREEYTAQQSALDQKKRKRSTWVIGSIVGVLLLLMILGGSACGTYNSLTTKQENVKVAFSDVDVQLQRRADLIPNLVQTVKGYAQHEEKVFSDIAEARSRLLSAQTVEQKSAANDQVSSALGRLLALQENYPNLKADQQFLRLSDELAGTENRISVARRDYNQVVNEYNRSRQQFPTVVMANILGFERAEEFKADAAAREVPKVDFQK
jgi:LemA protein